ncbi:MAG TPA: tryptophan synthase subunit alpha [Methanoregulaceae archaeon]|nr:tryptophan synthase subunit alpha [Methanoregulaceae archaeon]HPD09472.1 tryptophan synthase subunit alpha [Methanoregulaceae archaeon]HRT14736.1 tryptophan synthase subunit alpha [Methanoregulaceae archaeon]HRU30309.1 tryptophan synthase subunit alpha [Methanoregulaceae archaeon]
MAPETLACLRAIKKRTKLPVVPGFGISSPEHVREYGKAGADGVIVGSAIVRIVGEHARPAGKAGRNGTNPRWRTETRIPAPMNGLKLQGYTF